MGSLVKIALLSKKSTVKSQKREKPILIMGNGPSIKEQFQSIEENRTYYDVLCVNNFPNTEYYTKLKPDYFIILSEEYWTNDTTIDQNKQTRYDIITALIEKTDWPIDMFIPVKSKRKQDFLDKIAANKFINVLFYNTTPIEGYKGVRHWGFKNKLGMPRPHNVLIPSLIVMINAGYKRILLLGADHSWLPEISVDDNNNALISQKHFYESVMDKKAHMYVKGRSPRRLHEILHKFMLSFKAYHTLKEYADYREVSVLNCTENSFIDAFDRKTEYELWTEYASDSLP